MKLAGQLVELVDRTVFRRYKKEAELLKLDYRIHGFYSEIRPVYTLTKAEVKLLKERAKAERAARAKS